MKRVPKILVVVPCWMESARVGALLDSAGLCAPENISVSWLLVDDGSGVQEAAALTAVAAGRAEVLALPAHEGKGGALAAGFALGLERGFDSLAFLDADGAASPAELGRALALLNLRPELSGVIGSRVMMLGRRVSRSALRHYLGRVFATFVGLLFSTPTYDTQCGLKAFRASAVRRHLNAPSDRRWVWDTQLLLAMLSAGEAVVELPIDWTEMGGSRLNLRDVPGMALALLRFRFRDHGPA